MNSKTSLIALTAISAAVLSACGGGGGAGTADTATVASAPPVQALAVAAQLYITDNLATDYSKVWVSIKKITALDASGTEVTLLDASATPAVVNLSSLASVGQFMSAVSIPAGIYTEVRVTLDNKVQLVSLDGTVTTNALFSTAATDFVWRIRNVSLDATAGGQIVLDFNLAKFTYDASSGLVTPVVELPAPADAFGKWVRQQAELHGTVQSVDATKNTLAVNDPRLGTGVLVSLTADAVILNEADGKALKISDLTAGAAIEIKGLVTPGATTADPVTILASVIHVEPPKPAAGAASSPNAAASAVARGEGKVAAVSGSLVTVAIDEANFLPGANTVVVDIATAKFAHGQAADIVPGVKVEFGGTISGTGSTAKVTAAVFDVKGAQSAADREVHPGLAFSAVNGSVATLNADGTFSVTVIKADGPFVVPGTYTVDPKGATYIEGKATCLAVGAVVKAVGSLSTTTLTAKFLAVEGCGGQPRAEVPRAPSPAASAPGASASAPGPAASGPH
jgi:hypothetical protein